MKINIFQRFFLVCLSLLVLSSVYTLAEARRVRIGLSIDDLRVERWQKDRDFFIERADELGASVYVQSANGNEQVQISQIENLITRGVDVLVVVPFNGEVLSNVIAEAKMDGIKVIAYDRLIKNADIDLYISFDNVRVGEMQASVLVEKKPYGNYFMLGGSPLDNNAYLFREGQMNVIQPYIDEGNIKIVGSQWTKDWLPEEALKIVENALTATDNEIDAIVASNDGLAGAAIQALSAQGLVDKVAVSGQDADIAGVRRVAQGTQAMTVYKPIQMIARKAAEVAIRMAQDKSFEANSIIDNDYKSVPALLLDPIPVTKENLRETVVADGFHKEQDIYR